MEALALTTLTAPVTGGALSLSRTGNVYSLFVRRETALFVFSRSTTTKEHAVAMFDEERAALTQGMDITDPASGWVELE